MKTLLTLNYVLKLIILDMYVPHNRVRISQIFVCRVFLTPNFSLCSLTSHVAIVNSFSWPPPLISCRWKDPNHGSSFWSQEPSAQLTNDIVFDFPYVALHPYAPKFTVGQPWLHRWWSLRQMVRPRWDEFSCLNNWHWPYDPYTSSFSL